ncbi:hypothetical protein HDU91_004908 [Kappamyces sp. JEL0680]|nr:hypothetical protein HDU91_004908 [Kappamyces sp. JEL0680]
MSMQAKTAVYLSLALDPILNLFSIQTRLLSVPLKTLVDSSSGVTWFKSSACHSVSANSACAGNLIDPSALLAAGFKTNGVAFSLTYPFGLDPSVPNAGPETVSGQIWYGPVSIVGSALSPSFSFGLISSDSGNFPYDGVLGINNYAASSGSSADAANHLGNYMDAVGYALSSTRFSIYLANSDQDPYTSQLTIDGIDGNRLTGLLLRLTTGPLQWFDVVNTNTQDQATNAFNPVSGWSFGLNGMTVSVLGVVQTMPSTPVATSRINAFYVATGTCSLHPILIARYGLAAQPLGINAIVLDTALAAAINQGIRAYVHSAVGTGGNAMDCSIRQNGPRVVFQLGGSPINVIAANYIVQLQDGTCASVIRGGAEQDGYGIFGVPFLQAAYTVYKKSPQQIGFGQAVHYGNGPPLGSAVRLNSWFYFVLILIFV